MLVTFAAGFTLLMQKLFVVIPPDTKAKAAKGDADA